MQDLQKDISAALTLLEKGYFPNNYNKNYASIYLKTNENLGDYYKYFPIKDGNVSTIIGSGDHILQAIKDNPKEIHAFDKNILSIYMAKLKVASCQALDFDQYLAYFDYTKEYFLCKKYYKLIRGYLDYESKNFWDQLYIKGNIEKNGKHMFIGSFGNVNVGKNSFETNDNYKLTKSNIEKVKIKYYPYEFYEMFKKFNKEKKLDAIFLSNIYNWIGDYDKELFFLKYIKEELTKQMNNNGMVAVYCPPKYFFNNRVILIDDSKKISHISDNSMVVYKKK